MHERDPLAAHRRPVGSYHDQGLAGPGRRTRSRLRCGLVAVGSAIALLGFGAAPALAWDARTTEGTSAERRNTTTPLPPGGDQCSLGAPDSVRSLYDFSWACYAHDVCYQNHQLNGKRRSRLDCDNIMRAKMFAECDSRHGRFNPKRYACRHAANKYWLGVRAAGLPSWISWNGLPD